MAKIGYAHQESSSIAKGAFTYYVSTTRGESGLICSLFLPMVGEGRVHGQTFVSIVNLNNKINEEFYG